MDQGVSMAKPVKVHSSAGLAVIWQTAQVEYRVIRNSMKR